jgi:hypothetical protein
MTIRLRFAALFLALSIVASLSARSQTAHLTHQEIVHDLFASVPQPFMAGGSPGDETPAKKAVGLAAVYSLLLPGMGELYAQGFNSGKYFLMAEGALWITYAAFDIHGNDLRDGARAFAAARAGVDLTGKDDQFFVDVGNFLTMDDYNDKRLRDREPERLYSATAGQYWRWDSDESRLLYREQRISSEDVYNNRKFVVGAIVINHVISAINAARAAIAYNSSLEKSLGTLELSSRVFGGPGQEYGVLITLSKTF